MEIPHVSPINAKASFREIETKADQRRGRDGGTNYSFAQTGHRGAIDPHEDAGRRTTRDGSMAARLSKFSDCFSTYFMV